jgi:site-specific DNA-methyltransferase (adenine-specific)
MLPTAQFSAKKYGMDIDHFAVFPEEIPRICIDAGCPPGGIVLDPFMGSGTTAVVAMRMSRKWVGIELNPNYCELIVKRVKKLELPLLNEV